MWINKFKYFTFTYFDSSIEQIEGFVLKNWGNCKKYKITYTPFKFDLYESSPLRGGAHFEKAYFFAPKSCESKCVMFPNYSDGLSSLVYRITHILKIKAYSFRIGTDDFPDTINAFSYIENGKERRTVYAMKDPKWKFYCQGEIQPFEDEKSYQTRMIKLRLNKDILISYCVRLGFDIRDDDFWESKQSILLERLSW